MVTRGKGPPLRPRTLGAIGFPNQGTPPQGMALLRAEGRWSTPKSVAIGVGARAGPLCPFSATGQPCKPHSLPFWMVDASF